MWSLRRAVNPLRKQGSWVVTSRSYFTQLEVDSCSSGNCNARLSRTLQLLTDRSQSSTRFLNTKCSSESLFIRTHSFSSQAGTKSSGEEDDPLEDGFSELETSVKLVQEDSAYGDELSSEPEHLVEDVANGEVEGPEDELDLSDTEIDTSKKSDGKVESGNLVKAITTAPALSIHKVMTKWVEDGNEIYRPVMAATMIKLRKLRMYSKALQLSDWLQSNNNYEFTYRDYASRLDLISKLRGVQKAEDYLGQIPKSFRNEYVYRTLLANCVSQGNVNKAEKVFNQMKDLKLPLTSFACNQLLILYKRFDKKKIADILLLMEQENVKPSLFTYKILIDVKGQVNDISGMEKIVDTMKAEGIDPDFPIKCILARHYASGGLQEKAEAVLKEMEGAHAKENRWVCTYLLPLYAGLGKADDVERIWQVCESNPRLSECVAAIGAFGKLGRIEEAEAVFDMMAKKYNKLSSIHYSALLRVYAENKMLEKGKDVVKRMAESNCYIGPGVWDALVKLYVDAGEVEKADSILHKAVEQNKSRQKPLFTSYITIMDQYAKRGDVHNTEKMFNKMRKAGYVRRIRPFQSLLQAYINAKAPPYGFIDRMKADNIFPTRSMMAQLAQVDAFRRTAISDLID